MSLLKNNTKWVLFLSSSKDPEHRHVLDLAFGLYCLEIQHIDPANIFIYIDGQDRQLLSQLIANGSSNTYQIKESIDFSVDQSKNSHENLVMFVTGHGGIDGIDAAKPITPYALLQQIKSAPNLKQAVVYLGPCQVGIFNYIGAGRKNGAESNEPELVIVGATNLNESISTPTQETLVNGPMSWSANLFLLHIFKWISNPIDVDGDGKKTVIDSYKYAGAMSNNVNKSIKINTLVQAFDFHPKWLTAKNDYAKDPSPQNQLNFDAISTQYQAALDIQYINQECWILNAIPAQAIEF